MRVFPYPTTRQSAGSFCEGCWSLIAEYPLSIPLSMMGGFSASGLRANLAAKYIPGCGTLEKFVRSILPGEPLIEGRSTGRQLGSHSDPRGYSTFLDRLPCLRHCVVLVHVCRMAAPLILFSCTVSVCTPLLYSRGQEVTRLDQIANPQKHDWKLELEGGIKLNTMTSIYSGKTPPRNRHTCDLRVSPSTPWTPGTSCHPASGNVVRV